MRRLHNRVPAYAHLIELVANDIDLALAKLVEADGPQTTITLHGPRKYRDAVVATVRTLGVTARRKGIRGDIVIDVASWQKARARPVAKKGSDLPAVSKKEEIEKDVESMIAALKENKW